MKMVMSNPDNIWRVVTAQGESLFIKCPSKSGAKTFVAGMRGGDATPFRTVEVWLESQIPEGSEVIQARFRHPADPDNWLPGNV